MKTPIIFLAIILLIAQQSESFAQVPRTITYQGIIQKDGSSFTGDGVFSFTLYKHATAVWNSQSMTIHVTGGLFSTVLGPFPDSIQLNGIDSLGITFGGTELSPRVAFTSVAYSLYAQRAVFADSSRTSGPKGDPGQQGLQGLAGLKGDIGTLGLKGDKGDVGSQGVLGTKGDKGDKGDGGLQGVLGTKGDKGDKGEGGLQGVLGTKGDKGDKGEGGSQGTLGTKGDKGDKGDGGLQGVLGRKGDKGEKGDGGLQGVLGLKGDKGDGGSQGVKGDVGSQGTLGTKGDKGDGGSQGVKGDKGDVGSQGILGSKCDKGDGGSQGVKGDKGVNSLSSTTGDAGTIFFSLNQVSLVRTGDAGTLRLQNANPSSITYSAFWHTTNAVGTGNGTVNNGSTVDFTVAGASQFSIMVKVGNQWGKVDLFRAALTDIDWYGSSTTN